ncbi:MAG TPA: nucleotide sugar dehydrogenase [Flavobacteriales bacterium]|nr:nucleotide sugar dehydrogenase [Flavobacteriales bacterium]
MSKLENPRIAVIGLGYVGLPLAVEFAKKYPTVGFDINTKRVQELQDGQDHTLEVEDTELQSVIALDLLAVEANSKGLFCTTAVGDIEDFNFYIVTVPTPTDKNKRPVLTPLIKASESIGKVLKKGDYVVYESTVYPGVTEDECVPVLEQVSRLKMNEDFFVGYSPERINPGDKERTVTKILKVTSGSTPEAAEVIDNLYKEVITAGTYKAASIKVAEAAKVIENSQRDINIAFVNELAKIFNKLDIDTHAVLEAAGTKWNFLPFKPGLVGGHCIGVDPYYLAQKAQEAGYHPEIILSGRRLNDDMGKYVAGEVVKLMMKRSLPVLGSNVLMLGITFKENCPDIRNSRAIDVYQELKSYNVNVDVYDPWANPAEVKEEFGFDNIQELSNKRYHSIILAVSHKEFLALDLRSHLIDEGVLYDVKGILPLETVDARL